MPAPTNHHCSALSNPLTRASPGIRCRLAARPTSMCSARWEAASWAMTPPTTGSCVSTNPVDPRPNSRLSRAVSWISPWTQAMSASTSRRLALACSNQAAVGAVGPRSIAGARASSRSSDRADRFSSAETASWSSQSGGRSWKAVGRIEGAPGAVSTHEGEVFVAVQEGPILQSSDGGVSWKVRVAA